MKIPAHPIYCRQAVKSAYVLTNKWINDYLFCLADKKRVHCDVFTHIYHYSLFLFTHPHALPRCTSPVLLLTYPTNGPHSSAFTLHVIHDHLLLPTASQCSSCLTSYTHTCLNRDSTCDRLWLISYSTMIFSCIQLTVNVITSFFFKAEWNSIIRTGHTVFTYLLIGM